MTAAFDPLGLVLGGGLVVGLFGYLLTVLIHPERF
ncbi:F subunit of K+-transporting ATPase (potass_KdpF) [mine drainage metagenome]|uniref:F subunit of K+-transporting ATPase (Potass_KdpF) n=1 Tax=mine drainage metagenome TaxID=410659 RepID=A0A1J5SKL8_9ZZZZ